MANNSDETFMWKRAGGDLEQVDDTWDDSLLIAAYEKATKQVNQALKSSKSPVSGRKKINRSRNSSISQSSDTERERRLAQPSSSTWSIDQHCSSTYTEDGVDYEAQVIKIMPKKRSCIVRYLGYNNEEEQWLDNLKPSQGPNARQTQIEEAALDALASEDPDVPTAPQVFSPIIEPSRKRLVGPPPMSIFQEGTESQEDESLASMLMSWYMSGYHTGYYRAMKQSKACQCKCKP
jgi:survival motor neuron protein